MHDERSNSAALGGAGLLIAAALALAASHSGLDWLGHLPLTLRSIAHLPLTRALTLVPAVAVPMSIAGAVGAVVLRVRCTRATLASRVSYVVLAADDFDPSEEAVLRASAQLGRVRRAVLGWLDPRASAVRVRLDSGPDGRMVYRVQVARRARSVVQAAFGSLGNVELREEAEPATAATPKHVARAELVLARPSSEPLGLVGLAPDPLQLFANAFASVRERQGESASVVLDLLPAAANRRRRLRARLLAQARSAEQGGQSGLIGVLIAVLFPARAQQGGQQRASLSEQVERRAEARQLATKVLEHDPLFQAQVLLRIGAESEVRARGHVEALLSCFDAFAGQNWWRVAGFNLLGLAFRGADASARSRQRFDRRFHTGLHRPSRDNLVTAREVGALLKPPSKHCNAPNVLTLGGSIPPPPPGLPTFRRQRNLLPLGRIADGDGGQRVIGLPLRETFFTYFAGRSRYGKTEQAINQFLHLVRSGHGGLFLDPHEDAIRRIKAHLTEPELASRIIEVNLAGTHDHRQIAWNLFSMRGHGSDDIEKKVAAVVDSFASVLGWDERASRAMNLVTQGSQTLLELALALPPELAPNIFTLLSLLSSDGWRNAMLRYLTPVSREFWKSRFPRLPQEAITPVTNLVDRMRASRAVASLFGAPVSGYDIRRAMDEGKIVLACPGAGGLQQNRVVANLLVYDLLHAALTRAEVPAERRRLFFAFVDEAQTVDGASNGNLAALLEQSAKFGVRLFLFNQDPERLSSKTWSAIKTNRSHLMTTVVSAEAAVLLARQWGGDIHPATITRLPRFSFVASVTLDREISRPFLVQGVPVEEMWGDVHHPERLEVVDRIISRNTGRQGVADVLKALNSHDARILDYLRAKDPGAATRGRPRSRRTWRTAMPPELSLTATATEALDLLYQHRLLSTPQLGELLAMPYTERSVIRVLDRLRSRELVACVQARTRTARMGHRLWFLTQLGAEVVEAVPDRAESRRRLLTPALAAGQLQAHTLAVNEVGLAFMRAARERGHDFGPYSWRHEVAHELDPRMVGGRGHVIADSVLRYWMPLPDGLIAVRYRFVEVDRANRLVDDVVGNLARYARLREIWADRRAVGRDPRGDAPRWTMLYRYFPGVIVVLTNAGRSNLTRRLSNLLALCRAEPELGSPDGVSVSFVFFEDLMACGPFAPIFRRLEGERPVNWLGQDRDETAQKTIGGLA